MRGPGRSSLWHLKTLIPTLWLALSAGFSSLRTTVPANWPPSQFLLLAPISGGSEGWGRKEFGGAGRKQIDSALFRYVILNESFLKKDFIYLLQGERENEQGMGKGRRR